MTNCLFLLLLLASAPSMSLASDGERSEVRHRAKRGFIVPGTLWCGSGNKAPSFKDLGVFSETDSCCREHDQCKDTILSFRSRFGVFNSNIFTMSHCDCDNKFRQCLHQANDSISDVVGYTFFNLLKMRCFTFSQQLQCMERNWFGMCKETQMALHAEVHSPNLYESDLPTETPAADVMASENVTMAADAEASCDVFRELDECGKRIRPKTRKFGIYNEDWRTMFDCDCTNRFFQNLPPPLNQVQEFLSTRVSTTCFRLKGCAKKKDGKRCDAVTLQVEPSALLQRPLAAWRSNNNNTKKFYKLCVRMMRGRLRI